MVKIIGSVILILLNFSCQTLQQKDEIRDPGRTTQLNTKVKILDASKNKTHTATANWHISQAGLLRIDVLGPFDILMAQGFRDSAQVTFVDHRQKIIMTQSNSKPLIIDGYELPINDLVFLLVNQKPKGWNCKPDISDKLTCQKGGLDSKWSDPSTLVVKYSPYELQIKIQSSKEVEKADPNTFQFVWPKSYRVLNP
jgi:hypothetical protein